MIHFAFEFTPEHPRAKTLEGYVVWNACDKAKKAIHKRRGASLSGNADANPSTFERPLSAFGKDGDDDDGEGARESILALVAVAPAQEDALDIKRAAERAAGACRTVRERVTIRALRDTGSLDGAASRVYEDPGMRAQARVGSEERALRVVVAAAIKVAERLIA